MTLSARSWAVADDDDDDDDDLTNRPGSLPVVLVKPNALALAPNTLLLILLLMLLLLMLLLLLLLLRLSSGAPTVLVRCPIPPTSTDR